LRAAHFVLVLSACATVGPLPEHTAAQDGGEPPPDDAGQSTDDHASPPPVDAGADTAPRDTGAGTDAPAEAAGPTFCDLVTPKPTFCADFDRGKSVESGWSQILLDPGGTAQLGVQAKSLPYAFNAVSPATKDGEDIHVLLIDTVSTSAAGASLAFDVRFAKAYTVGPNSDITYARMRFPFATNTYHIQIGNFGGQGQLIETTVPNGGQPQYVMHNCAFPGAGTWVRVVLDVTLTSPASAKLTYDGSLQLDTAISPTNAGGIPTFEVGLDVGGLLESTNASFDNVTFVVK
jgi:hypothetical protein